MAGTKAEVGGIARTGAYLNRPRVHLRDLAASEISEIAGYIAARNYDAGQRFYDAATTTFDRLAEMPRIGTLRPVKKAELHGLRSCPIDGYGHYLVFYMPHPRGGIDVVHVLHGMRDVQSILENG